MNPLQSPIDGDMDEFRKHENERAELKRRMDREAINHSVDEYIRLVGRDAILRKAELVRMQIASFNRLMGRSVRLSVPTLEAMMVAVASVPTSVGMDIATRPQFADLQMILQAIHRVMQLDNQTAVHKAQPEL